MSPSTSASNNSKTEHKLSEQDIEDLTLAAADGIHAWNKVCNSIKSKYGSYPSDWRERVIMSGLMSKIRG